MQLVFSFNPSAFEVWQFLGHIEDLEVQKYKTILVNTYLSSRSKTNNNGWDRDK